jgi:hypothetical protein
LEVLVVIGSLQISIFLGDGAALQHSVLDLPLLLPHLYPAGEVLTIKQLNPVFARQFGLALGEQRMGEQTARKNANE